MAITDYKITSADIAQVHVEKQPTVLQGSALQNKQVFDAYPDMIVEKFNGALDEIANDVSAEIDRDVLELYQSLGWTPPNNQ